VRYFGLFPDLQAGTLLVRGLQFAEAPAMSAPPVDLTASTTASGYEDGFGRRVLAFDREDGSIRERLYLRPEFSIYEHALRDAFARLTVAADPQLVAPRVVERDSVTGKLVAVSDFASGERLADLLERASEVARDEGAVPGIEVALGFLLAVLPALDTLRSTTGLPHGALTPSRCVLASDGRVILTECGFAGVLQRLNFNRRRLWREFRIAVPPVAGATRFDPTADVGQAALAAVMLVLGRPMQDGDDPADTLPDLIAEVIEIAQIRSNVSFAINLQRFLQRALPLPGRRPYQTVDAALNDVRQLASGIGVELCKTSLADFVCGTITTPAGALIAHEPYVSTPVAQLERVTPEPARSPEISAPPPGGEEFEIDIMRFEESPAPAAEFAAAEFEDVYEEPSAPAVEFVAEEFDDVHVDASPPPSAVEDARPMDTISVESAAAFEEAQPAVVIEAAPPARSRRSRSRRRAQDALRSSVAPAPQLPPAPAHVAGPAPAQEKPAVVAPEPIVVPVPVFPQAIPAPLPVFTPLRVAATEGMWEAPRTLAPPVATAPTVTIAPRAVPIVPTGLAPVRLKSEPDGFKMPSTRYEPREFSAGQVDRRRGAVVSSRGVPWKFAAAAAAILVTLIAAGRSYLPDGDTFKAEAKGTRAPVTVAAPPPVTTGTIVVNTQPAGARVLLDGSPAGETPLRIVDVAPGKHVLTFLTQGATVKRTVKIEADKILTLDVPVFSGWVAIFAPILLEVSQEGRALGNTEQGRLMLPPGRHTLTLTNRDFGYSASHAVEIEAGEVRSLNVQPTGTLNLNAVPWAEVWIDGKKAGETPIANLQLPLGNREIIFKHPEYGERRMMTAITAGAPSAVSVDFLK
jgi:hypothetical protein